MLKAVPQEVPRKGKSGQRGRDPVPQVRDGRQSASEVIQHFKSRKSQRFPSALLELPSEPTVHELIRLLGKDQKTHRSPIKFQPAPMPRLWTSYPKPVLNLPPDYRKT